MARISTVAVVMFLSLLCSAAAWADTGGTRDANAREVTGSQARRGPGLVALDLTLGAGIDAARSEGIGLMSGTVLVRPSWLTLGLGGQVSGAPFGRTHEYVGVLAGTTLGLTDAFQIDALAELGTHFVQPSSARLFEDRVTNYGDTNATTPYAGIRLSPAFVLGRSNRRFLIGAWLDARQDLSHDTAHYTQESCGSNWFTGDYSCSTSDHTLRSGGLQLAAGLRLGSDFGG